MKNQSAREDQALPQQEQQQQEQEQEHEQEQEQEQQQEQQQPAHPSVDEMVLDANTQARVVELLPGTVSSTHIELLRPNTRALVLRLGRRADTEVWLAALNEACASSAVVPDPSADQQERAATRIQAAHRGALARRSTRQHMANISMDVVNIQNFLRKHGQHVEIHIDEKVVDLREHDVLNSVLNGVTELKLANSMVHAVPTSLRALVSLKTLRLEHIQLREVPESIGMLVRLVTLSMAHNELTVLPPCLGKLSRLRHLDLSHNKIAEAPSRLGSMNMLESLNMAHNMLREVSAA